MNTPSETLTEEEYLAASGYGRSAIGEPALHKNRGSHSDKVWSKIVQTQAVKDRGVIERRQQLRDEYQEKIRSGQIRAPSRYERLKAKAAGHPDLESTQAAKRLLAKYFGE